MPLGYLECISDVIPHTFSDKNTNPIIVPIPSNQNKGSSNVVYPVSTGSQNQNQSPLIVPISNSQNQGSLFEST